MGWYVVRHPELSPGVYDVSWVQLKPYFMNENGVWLHNNRKKHFLKSAGGRDEALMLAREEGLPETIYTVIKLHVTQDPSIRVGHPVEMDLYLKVLDHNADTGCLVLCPFGKVSAFLQTMPIFSLALFGVRSPGATQNSLDKYDIMHVPQLSPSNELFHKYRHWKDVGFTDDEQDQIDDLRALGSAANAACDDPDWWLLYKPLFLEEMRTRPDLVAAINRLKARLAQKDNVVLSCYCTDITHCHTYLIGLYLLSQGFIVYMDYKEFIREIESL